MRMQDTPVLNDSKVDGGASLSPPSTTGARPELVPPRALEHPFRFIAFDWDGTAVDSRKSDASHVVSLLDRLMSVGVRVAVVTGTNLQNVMHQVGHGVRPENGQRFYVSTNRGSEVFGFDRRGKPELLWSRIATPDENDKLDKVATLVKEQLERTLGIPIGVVMDRMNRRKIDLIPEPAWKDPPKDRIGELLAATEARLRNAGLRGGIREAFELTERVAKEVGLADAKVTSDVKHLEVGLTDKADAMATLIRSVAHPLAIAAEDMLILGDEFGPIGGFEGSDHKMVEPKEAAGALVVSVGPEPGGTPEGVIHLGGGPACFGRLMEQQLSLDLELGPFTSPRDAAWVVEQPGFDLAREHEIESLLAIGNGYVGSRGASARSASINRPSTFLAGAFEPSNDVSSVPELVVLPEWRTATVSVDGERLGGEEDTVTRHKRTLDMRRGRVLHEAHVALPSGRAVDFRSFHLASLAERRLLLWGLQVEPVNFSGTVSIEASISGDVRSASGAVHWAKLEPYAGEIKNGASRKRPELVGVTHGGLVAVMASEMRGDRTADTGATFERESGPGRVSETCARPIHIGVIGELTRTVLIATSRAAADPLAEVASRCDRVRVEAASELVARHDRAWAERWRRTDIEIVGAPKLERALRFAAYHLISAANPEDDRCSIGARALTGEAYRGHVFWDTDVFMLPFYLLTWPEAARALVRYRHLTIGGAKRKAKALGYEGALYAWESADTGDETTPSHVVTPLGEVIRVLSGDEEHHIAADVAWGVWLYGRTTGDRAFMEREGLEILFETARFWASRGVDGADGGYHIQRVIGPDEYHETIDDNAFTNWLARFNLVEAANALERATPARRAELGVREGEIARFRDVAARMTLLLDPKTGLVEQFRGFNRLAYVDLAAFEPRHAPMDVLLGRARTQVSQVVKQADVVQLLAMLWDELGADARRANFMYYEPRTGHGSSLSPGIHALVAARLGMSSVAARYFDQTADIDLGNNMGNSSGGVHAAALGSLWQAVVFGACGVRPSPTDPEALILEPNLLPEWRHVVLPLAFRGADLEIVVEPAALEIACRGDVGAKVTARGQDGGDAALTLEPGRRYAARRTGEGFEPWGEIDS